MSLKKRLHTKKKASGKPSLLFVDHVFHKKTRSFDFLVKVLEKDFDVKTTFVDLAEPVDEAHLIDDSEYVVIGQMDFLTPIFITAGKKVVVVQMYDGSAWLPDSHWHLTRQARYLNFSVTLHARALSLGCESMLVRYFTDPSSVKPVTDLDTLRGFFWQRCPRSGINANMVRHMLGDQLSHLHIHTTSDDGTPFDEADLEGFSCSVTHSSWFEKQSDFAAVMDNANVFIAPRRAEGIGHVFLEAMARGMVVIAHDLPTHNEYIHNWTNGILFSEVQQVINLRDQMDKVRAISDVARLTVQNGHCAWVRDHDAMLSFVRETPAPALFRHPSIQANISRIVAAYQQGPGSYENALSSYSQTCNLMASWRDFEAEGETDPARRPEVQKDIHVFMGHGNSDPLLREGWSNNEVTHRWAIAKEASLHIPLAHDVRVTGLSVIARGLEPGNLTVKLGGTVVTPQPLALIDSYKRYQVDLPKPTIAKAEGGVDLSFEIEKEPAQLTSDLRTLTFSLKSLNLITV